MLMLHSLVRPPPPYELLQETSDSHLILKTVSLFTLVSAKGVNKLHGLSFSVGHSSG